MRWRKLDKLEIIVGRVVDVQIIERLLEPAPPARTLARKGRRARPAAPAPQPAPIIGRQRIFVDGPGAKDPHYDFDRCELAVRREQEVAIARIPARRKRHGPINVMLLNRTMDEAWPFPAGLAMLAPPPRIEVRTKALVSAIAAFALLYLVCRFLVLPNAAAVWWIAWPLLGALALYFVFWGALLLYRRPAQEARRRSLVMALHQKLKAAPGAAAPAPSHPPTETAAAAPPVPEAQAAPSPQAQPQPEAAQAAPEAAQPAPQAPSATGRPDQQAPPPQ
jgi:hypothetical protein